MRFSIVILAVLAGTRALPQPHPGRSRLERAGREGDRRDRERYRN
jgi:hypothetical protein